MYTINVVVFIIYTIKNILVALCFQERTTCVRNLKPPQLP